MCVASASTRNRRRSKKRLVIESLCYRLFSATPENALVVLSGAESGAVGAEPGGLAPRGEFHAAGAW